MPWRQATIRGQRIFARVREDGRLDESGGRVEIRYKANDPRAYQAAVKNLVLDPSAPVLADDTCVPGEAPQPKARNAKAAKGTKKTPTASAATHAVSHARAWIAYTDGACTGNPGPAGSGWVLVAPGGSPVEAFAYLGEGTNNIAELTAIQRALHAVPKEEPLVVHTDSQYAIGVLTRGWKAKANTELIDLIRGELRGRRDVRFVYVPGHAGVPLNERADELAREAIRTGRSSK
jgi:ribonuclease HI